MNYELQDAVALALEVRLDVNLETAISIAEVRVGLAEQDVRDALRAFEAMRATGSKAQYLAACAELTEARERLEDYMRQAGR